MKSDLLTKVTLKVLKELLNKIPQGCFIGKVESRKEKNHFENDLEKSSGKIVKEGAIKGKKYFLCEGRSLGLDGRRVKVKISLIEGDTKEVETEKTCYIEEVIKSGYNYLFSKEEISNFCLSTGDDNYIHRGEKVVVPGMLILQNVEKYILKNSSNSLEMITGEFYLPLYAEEIVFIEEVEQKIIGYSQTNKCFQIRYERENFK